MTPPASGYGSGSYLDAASAQALALAYAAQRAARQHAHWAVTRKQLQVLQQQLLLQGRSERSGSDALNGGGAESPWAGSATPLGSQPHLDVAPPSQSSSRKGLSIDPGASVFAGLQGATPVDRSAGTPRSAGLVTPMATGTAAPAADLGLSGPAGLAVPYMLPESRYAAPAALPEYSARFWADVAEAALGLTRLPGSPPPSAAASAEATDGPGANVLRAVSAAVHSCQSEAVRATGAAALHRSVGRVLALARESPQPAPVLSPLTACDALRAQMLVVLLEAGLARALVFAALSPAAAHPLLQRAAAAELQYVVALSIRLLPSPHADAAWNLPDLVQVGWSEWVWCYVVYIQLVFLSLSLLIAYRTRCCAGATSVATRSNGPVRSCCVIGC